MEKINTIVAALDLESSSNAVLGRAIQLATAHAARLIVLHVIEPETLSQATAQLNLSKGELRDRLKRQALGAIEPLVMESERTRRTDIQVEFGSSHGVIIGTARKRHADLVLIGPGKARSLKEKILGSTADRVVRTSPAPVLLVKKRSTRPFRRVVVAVDFSLPSETAVKKARSLVPEATLQLVHVVDIPLAFQRAMLGGGATAAELEKYQSMQIHKLRDELAALADHVGEAGKVTTRILKGEPAPTLIRFSTREDVDLLAIGPRGHGGVLQALLGSVTRRVLGEAVCDVLVACRRP